MTIKASHPTANVDPVHTSARPMSPKTGREKQQESGIERQHPAYSSTNEEHTGPGWDKGYNPWGWAT